LIVNALQPKRGGDGDNDAQAHHLIAAPLRSRSHPNSNTPGRGGEDDENLIVGPVGGGNDGIGRRTEEDPNLVIWNEEQITSPQHRTRLTSKPHINAGGRMMVGVRRLTPTECERLQGFPDEWTEGLSDTARYRVLGNAVCVAVAEWIGHRILESNAKAHSRRSELMLE
jgi:site-specific DNA-cytosine methylase